jgi:hypothetical protein
MAGAVMRAEAEHTSAIVQAYMAAALTRAKRLPRLETLTRRQPRKNKHQSREELQAMCDALAAAWGAQKE